MKELKDYSIKDHPHYGSTRLNGLMIGFFIGLVVRYWMGGKEYISQYGDDRPQFVIAREGISRPRLPSAATFSIRGEGSIVGYFNS